MVTSLSQASFGEHWVADDLGNVFDCNNQQILSPVSGRDCGIQASRIAERVTVCVNALRTLRNATIQSHCILMLPTPESILMAQKDLKLLDWCETVLKESGYTVIGPD